MKIPSRKVLGLALGASVLTGAVHAQNVVQTFSITVPLTASPSGLVSFDTTWNVPQYAGAAPLTGVQYDISTRISYQGQLVSLVSSQSFNLKVRGDFNFILPGSSAAIGNLDPVLTLNGTTPATVSTVFSMPSNGTAQSNLSTATQLASDLVTYVGSGTVAIRGTGTLNTASPGGTYGNTSDIGLPTPYVFVDDAKVFPLYGLQQFGLESTLVVTYYSVPESSTYAAGGLLTLATVGLWIRRRARAGGA